MKSNEIKNGLIKAAAKSFSVAGKASQSLQTQGKTVAIDASREVKDYWSRISQPSTVNAGVKTHHWPE